MSKRNLIFIIIVSLLLNIISYTFIFFPKKEEKQLNQNMHSRYSLLSPRIFAERQNDRLVNFVPLRTQLNAYYEKVNVDMGFYFEYLPSGISIGVNEKESFILASLLKTPLVMGVYKQLEKGIIHRNDIVTIKEEDLDPLFGNLWEKGVGFQLSLLEAIKYTLIDSDNTAKNVLFSSVPEGTLEDVFDALDIPKDLSGSDPVVTPKNYSSILRSLYLSSYLTEESSQEILYLLTQTPFNDKLAAGVPKTVRVSHKIGVHRGGENANAVFTDCGIIYEPKRPYILCIMTKSSEPVAKKHMKEISKLVYEYVSNANYEKSNK